MKNAIERGRAIEELSAVTDYKDWYYIGQTMNGFFSTIDFQDGINVVSMKSIDPRLDTYASGKVNPNEKVMEYIDDLNRNITVGGEVTSRTLDLRIPEGTRNYLEIDELITYANSKRITLKIEVF